MPIIGAAFGKSITVDRAIAVAEQLGILSVPGDSVTLEIGQVPGERRRGKAVSFMPHDPRLDDHAPLTGARGCAQAGDPPPREATRPATSSGSTRPAATARPVDRKSTRLNSRHYCASRMPSSACKHKHK